MPPILVQSEDQPLPRHLSSLAKYESLRTMAVNNNINHSSTSKASMHRIHNIDVIHDDETGDDIGLCHFIVMNVHTTLDRNGNRMPPNNDYNLESTAAVALAVQHLNTGNGKVVREIDGLNERCNIRFTVEFWDTQGEENIAVDQVMEALDRDPINSEKPLPCAFIGAHRSLVSKATSLLTGMKEYPQISPLSSSPKLDDKDTYPLFGRTVPSADGYGTPIWKFLYYELKIKHLAVVHSDDSVSMSIQAGIVAASQEYPDVTVKTCGFPEKASDMMDFLGCADKLKESGYRFFFAAISDQHVVPLMEAAIEHDIAGTGVHNWILSNSGTVTTSIEGDELSPESPMLRALTGLITIAIVASPGTGRYDSCFKEWRHLGQSDEDLQYLQSKLPRETSQLTSSVFDEEIFYTTWAYDAAILLGLGACTAKSTNFMSGTAHYNALMNTTFVGASGTVELDPSTGTRNASSSVFWVTNAIPRKISNGNYTMEMVRTDYYDSGWFKVEPLRFNDGTTTIPLDLPEQEIDYHYVGAPLRSLGLSMSAIVLLLSVGFGWWTQAKRKHRVIRASQPFFLNLICIGTFLMGSSIILLSIDDEIATLEHCNVACLSYPWFLSVGWVFAFSAVFTKTHRTVKVFHNPSFKRIVVTIADVMKPMLFLLGVNILILSLMTVYSPLHWIRDTFNHDKYDRVKESRGHCISDKSVMPFLAALFAVNLGVLLATVYQAYVARNISTEFAESECIAKAISCTLLVSFVGIPVVYIAENDQRSFFFVLSGVIFVICTSLLLFIFIPKMVAQQNKGMRPMKDIIGEYQSSSLHMSRNHESINGSGSDGAMVIEHPKQREDVMRQILELKSELESLREKFCDEICSG